MSCVRLVGLAHQSQPTSWSDSHSSAFAWAGELERGSHTIIVAAAAESWDQLPAIVYNNTGSQAFCDLCMAWIQKGYGFPNTAEAIKRLNEWAGGRGVQLHVPEPAVSKKPARAADKGPLWWELPKRDENGKTPNEFSRRCMDVTRVLCGGTPKDTT